MTESLQESALNSSDRGPSKALVRRDVALLILLALPLIFWRLGSYSVVNGDEALYHSVATNMVETGDWVRLEFEGQHRPYDTFMNAPTQYWARALLISAIGSNPWSMRLWSALCGLLAVLVTRAYVQDLAGRRAGLLAGLCLLFCVQFVFLHGARTGELDAAVCLLFVCLGRSFGRALASGKSFVRHHVLLAVLATIKLPIVIVPILAELFVFATNAQTRARFKSYALSGCAIVPLALIWHLSQAGVYWDDFRKATSTMAAEASGAQGLALHAGGPLENLAFYAKKALFGAFPQVLLFLPALVWAALSKAGGKQSLQWRICASFALAVWVFFCLVSKRYPWYVLPSYPFLCAMTGAYLVQLSTKRVAWHSALVVACTASLALWLRVDIRGFDPFRTTASRVPMLTEWWQPAWTTPILGALVCALVGFGALVVFARVAPERGPRAVAWVLCLSLLPLAGARSLAALGHTDYRSQMDRLAGKLARARAAGTPIDFPVRVSEPGTFKARHYFARHYRVEPVHGRPGVHFLLHPKPSRQSEQ